MEILAGLLSYNGYAQLKKKILFKKSFSFGFGSYVKQVPVEIT
jgi:hypothetical protein